MAEVEVSEVMAVFQESGLIRECVGDPKAKFRRVSAVETCEPGDLVFVDKAEYLELIQSRHPSVVVTSTQLRARMTEIANLTVLIASNVPLAHAQLKRRYADRDFARSDWHAVHPSAVVHPTARIAPSAVIEPRAVIGAGVTIGEGSRVMSGAVVEHDSRIGKNTVIHPLVVVGYNSEIGNEVVIGSGTVIGSEGFGFAQDEKRQSYPIPQTGRVVIEDRVRIGANNAIDRATYGETRIGAGTKIDNLCHIAHNVQIGRDCLLTAFLCVAGSSKIGDRVITSGQTGVLDHVEVANDVMLVQRAGVNKSVDKAGAYAGVPLLPLADYMKNQAVLRNAVDLRKRLMAVERALGIEAPKD